MSSRRHQLLVQAGQAFAAGFDPIAVPWNVVHFLVPRIAECAVVGLLDDTRTELRWAAHAHIGPVDGAHMGATSLGAARYPITGTPLARLLRSGRPLLLARLAVPSGVLPEAFISSASSTLLIVPLGRRRRTLGVLGLGRHDSAAFDAEDTRLACALALRAVAVLDIASRCRDMRREQSRLDAAWTQRPLRERTSRARRRAELTRQLVAGP